MLKFYFPFYYLFFSRLKTKIDLISWIIIFVIPPFVLTYIYADFSFGVFILLFLLSQVIFNTLYEIGYIENDISTTENEEVPTLRLDTEIYRYIKDNYSKIIIFRYAIVILSIALLYFINDYFSYHLNIVPFLILLVINRVFFYWHNSVRNRWNLLTFTVLAVTKYIFPAVLFVDSNKMLYVILILTISFPILRIIEHSTHKRYSFVRYAKLVGNHDKFRIVYYGFFTIIVIGSYFFSIISKEQFWVVFSVLIYFMLYRTSSYFLVKRGIYKRDNIKNKDLYVK